MKMSTNNENVHEHADEHVNKHLNELVEGNGDEQ